MLKKLRTNLQNLKMMQELLEHQCLNQINKKKLKFYISAFLFEMEHEDIDPDMAFAVNWHIEDFESGDYEYLFQEEDLKLLKADIKIIKEFLISKYCSKSISPVGIPIFISNSSQYIL